MKRNILRLFFAIVCVSQMNAQTGNPFWTLPPNYIPNPPPGSTSGILSLPTLGGAANYNGQTSFTQNYGNDAIGPHNTYTDPNGNILFSVISGFVFGPRGALIDTLLDTLTVNNGNGTTSKKRVVSTGWGETCIVPMVGTGNCSKYYVFSSTDYGSTGNANYKGCYENYPGQVYFISHRPCYAIIDMNQIDPNSSADIGKNTSRGTAWQPTVVDLFRSTSTASSDGSSCSPMHGTVHYACTRLIGGTSGYRFLFVAVNDEIIVYKLTSGTITFVENRDFSEGYLLGSPYDQLSNQIMSELEVYADSTAGIIKLATTMAGGDNNLVLAKYSFTTGKLDTTSAKSAFGRTNDHITGIEFSPNGSYVYVTRDSTAGDPYGVEAVNFSTPTLITPIAGTNKNDFGHSQMELGKDQKLYFIGQLQNNTPRLAQIATPNTPSSPGFTNSYLTLSNYAVSYPYVWDCLGGAPGNGQGDAYVFYLPDQIDQEVYGPQFSSSTCCPLYKAYDKNYYTSTTAYPGNSTNHDQTWKSGSNPFNNATTATPIYIESELRVAAGYTVTIQNLTFKFNPQASLVVEGKTGTPDAGKLVLKKCTLDVDTRCSSSSMWPGVRVWGNTTTGRSNGTQGWIIMDSSCVITNAWIGIEVGYNSSVDPTYSSIAPAPTGGTGNNSGGGLINVQNSSFINNQRDIYLQDYPSSGGTTSLFKNTFTTTGYLNAGNSTPILYHLQLSNYKPSANTQGNDFNCASGLLTSGYAYSSEGIHSINSNIAVDQYLTGSVRSKFANFNYGIYATSSNTNGPSVKNSSFRDNVIGAYYGGLTNPVFQSDSVFVRNPGGSCTQGCGPNYAGLFLENCTGYKVQFNYFKQFNAGSRNPFGVVASNSGAHVNCIFKNTFTNLYKGSQAQYRNFASYSTSPHNYVGLVYLCNTFSSNSISSADIYVPATASTANWGTAYTDTSAIQFNHGSQSSGYPQTGGNTFSKTSGGSDFWIETTGKVYGVNYIYYCAVPPCTGATNRPDNNNSAYVTLSAYTLADVNCSTDPYSNGLRISDPVQYMLSQANVYKDKSDSISNLMPALSADDSTGRFNLVVALGNARSTRHRLIDEAIHLLLEDTLRNDSTDLIVNALMKEKALELDVRTQLETGIAIQDQQLAANALAIVANTEGESNYVKLYRIFLNHLGQTPQQILSDPSVLSQVQSMETDSSDRTSYVRANLLLQAAGLGEYSPYYLESNVNSTQRRGIVEATLSNDLSSRPNPFQESTVITATIKDKTDNAFVVLNDLLGKEIGRYKVYQGENAISIKASDISQQIFFCTLVIDGAKIRTNKMVLIK